MIDAQLLSNESILREHHVVIRVVGKLQMESVARFAGSTMSNRVGKDNEVFSGVELLAWPKEDVGKLYGEKLRTRTSSAVHNQHSVARSEEHTSELQSH